MREKLLDPTGDSDQAVDTTLTPRLRSLRGLSAGLLDNAKPNASVLLAETGRELARTHGIRDFVMYQKGYFGTGAGPTGCRWSRSPSPISPSSWPRPAARRATCCWPCRS